MTNQPKPAPKAPSEYPLDAIIAKADAAWEPMNPHQSTEFASYRVMLEICKQLKIMNEKLEFIAGEVRRPPL